MEIRHLDAQWPCLSVGLAGRFAVIHLLDSPDSISLLRSGLLDGDAGAGPPEAVEVPIMNEPTTFDGAFALSHPAMRQVVQAFARGSILDALRWHRL